MWANNCPPDMTLLAHLVPRIAASGAEPAATQALAYVLESSKEAAKAFVRPLQDAGIGEFEPGLILAEEKHGDFFPDLTIRDTSGRIRIFVENKFWAGLQPSQPMAYLDSLPSDVSGAVLFIVPKERVDALWREVKLKCSEDDRSVGEDVRNRNTIQTTVDSHIMAMSSWSTILGRLEQAAPRESNTRQDIAQLRGLADSMSVAAFQPFAEAELTDGNVPRRHLNYVAFYNEFVERLVTDGIASIEGRREVPRFTNTGRFAKFHDRFEIWIGLDYQAWSDWGRSPMWFRMDRGYNSKFLSEIPPQILAGHFKGAEGRKDALYIPIRLPVGVDRSQVIEKAVNQVKDIGRTLQELFPASQK